MSRFSIQELFLAGMTVVVVGFTVAVGSSSLTSMVGLPTDSGKSDGQSQDTGEHHPLMLPPSGGSSGEEGQPSQKNDSDSRQVEDSDGGYSGKSEGMDRQSEHNDGDQPPAVSDAERRQWEQAQVEEAKTRADFWRRMEEERKNQEDSNAFPRGESTKDGTRYKEAMKQQTIHASPEEMLKSDINKDGVVNEQDVKQLQEMMKQHRDINGDGVVNEQDAERIQEVIKQNRVVTPEEDYGYTEEMMPQGENAQKKEVQKLSESVWEKLMPWFHKEAPREVPSEAQTEESTEIMPSAKVPSSENAGPGTEEVVSNGAEPKQEKGFLRKFFESLFGGEDDLPMPEPRPIDIAVPEGQEGTGVHRGPSSEFIPEGRPFNGMPVPGRPFNDFPVEGRPFKEIGTEEEPTSPYEDFLNDRNSVNGMNGVNGINGMQNGINGLNGINALPELPTKSRVFFDVEEKPELSVSLDKGGTKVPTESQEVGKNSDFWGKIKGWFGF